ncbi:MAG: AraC family transcriptional regulator [Spirochaetota bacterium]
MPKTAAQDTSDDLESLYTIAYSFASLHDNGFTVHEYAELAYIVSGSGTFTLDDEVHAVNAGTVVLIPPKCRHREQAGERGISILYSGFIAEAVDFAPAVISAGGFSLTYLFHFMLDELRQKKSDIIPHLVRCAWLLLSRSTASARSRFVEESIDFMKKNAAKDIDLSILSRRYDLNKNYFTTAFKKKTGRSPLKYIHELRVDIARRMLAGGMSVQKAASAVGYEDPYYFSRVFRKITGVSPVQFKRNAGRST